MFDLAPLQISTKVWPTPGLWIGKIVATALVDRADLHPGPDRAGRAVRQIIGAALSAAPVPVLYPDTARYAPGVVSHWALTDPACGTAEQIRPIRDYIHQRVRELLAELVSATTSGPAAP